MAAKKDTSAAVPAGSDKKKALETAMQQIEKMYGKGSIMRYGENAETNVEAIPTGSLALDLALGIGGVPRGRIIEIYGPESSGKTTLALHILAQAQKLGGEVAFVDAEHALDPTYARALGVRIEDMLISQPDTGEQALEITEALVRSGAIDVVVVDSVAALVPRAEIEGEMGDSFVGLHARLMSQALRKLTGAVGKTNTIVIFINQLREKGGGMYGNVNRKKKGDGTYYRDYFYYACKHRLHVDGKRCDYHHQWGEEIIDGAVEEIIHKLVNTPAFEQGIREKIGGKLDTAELDAEMEALRKQLRQLTGTKDRLGEQIDALDFDDPHYTRKAQDLQERQNRVYDQIASVEVSIAEVQTRMDNIRQHRISTDNVYQFLLYFDKLYDQFTDLEKKTFMNSFIERVEIYPERQSDGRIIKRIEFRFPVYFNGSKITGLGWNETDMSENVMGLAKL